VIASPLAERLLSRLHGVRTSGDGWLACCPAHDDRHPSLSIREVDGKLLLYCRSRHCEAEAIMRAVGFRLSDLFAEDGRPRPEARRSGRPLVIPEGDIPKLLTALDVSVRPLHAFDGAPYTDCWIVQCPHCEEPAPARISTTSVDGEIGVSCVLCQASKRRPSGFWRFTIPEIIRLARDGRFARKVGVAA
jgi:hypothetical protein